MTSLIDLSALIQSGCFKLVQWGIFGPATIYPRQATRALDSNHVIRDLGLGQTSNLSRVEYILNRCDKELTSFQRGSKRRTCVDPISPVALH